MNTPLSMQREPVDRKTFRKEVTLPALRKMRKYGLSYQFVGNACLLRSGWVSNDDASGHDIAHCLNTAAHARQTGRRVPTAYNALSTARCARVMAFGLYTPPFWRRVPVLAGPNEAHVPLHTVSP